MSGEKQLPPQSFGSTPLLTTNDVHIINDASFTMALLTLRRAKIEMVYKVLIDGIYELVGKVTHATTFSY